jgi:reductive dehalogenase
MKALIPIFLITGAVVSFLLGLFSIFSALERKRRAAFLGVLVLLIFFCVWFGGFFIFLPSDYILLAVVALVIVPGLLFFMPIGEKKVQKITITNDRVDERDIMFAREEYEPGTEKYDDYYTMRPEKKETDDSIRRLPELLAPGGKYFDPLRSSYVESQFEIQRHQVTLVDGPVNPNRQSIEPKEISWILKRVTLHLGADDVGMARLNPFYLYSHVGRGPEPWGAEIKNTHPYVIVFTVEMDYAKVEEAPGIGISEETALQYARVQRISIVLAEYIRSLGYPARAHIPGSNYQIMLPPVAYDAGLGEVGRLGYLISPRFGARIRLGAVTTEIPLVPDKPIQFGVQDFCEKCRKCALNCPPGAIPHGNRNTVRGAEKWQLDIEKCFYYWRSIGTDCGLCMRVCPFSHPNSLAHNILRAGIKRSSFARTVSVYGDDLFYGKKIRFGEFEA